MLQHALRLNPPLNHDETEETWEEHYGEEDDSGIDELCNVSETLAGTATVVVPAVAVTSTAVVGGAARLKLVKRGMAISNGKSSRTEKSCGQKRSSLTGSDDEDIILFKGRKKQCR
jgi:hypothetical protein